MLAPCVVQILHRHLHAHAASHATAVHRCTCLSPSTAAARSCLLPGYVWVPEPGAQLFPLCRSHRDGLMVMVVQRIKAVEGHTRLLVVDQETDEELRRRQLTCTEEMAQRGLPPAHDPWEPKPDWAHVGGRSSDASKKGPP
ncbi:hypothetical protein P7K49_022814 [Saguinus oedipus]|uniref:Uncharacterized protein n=1 Tax=Saguinus oedipus TaxID=9490 RepID=A0ABQ9UJZ5_SAGOE|nr:hypothetical protein P7K49_022814 [Saguinus oedipus]